MHSGCACLPRLGQAVAFPVRKNLHLLTGATGRVGNTPGILQVALGNSTRCQPLCQIVEEAPRSQSSKTAAVTQGSLDFRLEDTGLVSEMLPDLNYSGLRRSLCTCPALGFLTASFPRTLMHRPWQTGQCGHLKRSSSQQAVFQVTCSKEPFCTV